MDAPDKEYVKTTNDDFLMFQEFCNLWLRIFGLMDWCVTYQHKFRDGAYASNNFDMDGRVSIITLATDWPPTRPANAVELNKVALHEVLHLVLADLNALAIERFTSRGELNTAVESCVRRLEKVIFEPLDRKTEE